MTSNLWHLKEKKKHFLIEQYPEKILNYIVQSIGRPYSAIGFKQLSLQNSKDFQQNKASFNNDSIHLLKKY